MVVDHINKSVYLFSEDVGKEVKCPECGLPYKSNSTGPSRMPLVTSILHRLWSEKYLGGFPAHFHDFACLLVPAGWTVIAFHRTTSVKAKTKGQTHRGYLRSMLIQVGEKTKPGTRRKILRGLAHRNYLFVRGLGDSSFRHEH